MNLEPHHKVFVAGHKGLVGSAIVRALESRGHKNILTRAKTDLDLRDDRKVASYFDTERPDIIILAAARVGGVGANSAYPVEFLLENLQIQNAVISQAARANVKKLIFLGSSCIYPKTARYPLTEDQILAAPFEQTNEGYALAKVAGIKLCHYYHREYGKNFVSLLPTNSYGPNDFYHPEKSHVIPSMLLKIMKAKETHEPSVKLWGSGRALREFIHSDDLAEAILVCLEKFDGPGWINIGSQDEISIAELARLVCEACDYRGKIEWDTSKPDGVMRKVMDSSKIRALGWKPKRDLKTELKKIYESLLSSPPASR